MTAQLTTAQLDLATLRKSEQDARHQLDVLLADTDQVKAELSKLRLVHSGQCYVHCSLYTVAVLMLVCL